MIAGKPTSQPKRVPRFCMPEAKAQGQTLPLDEDLMHYASRVLRVLDGDVLRIWNGAGQEFDGTLHYLNKKMAQVTLTSAPRSLASQELRRPVHVLQALPEGDKMDWVLEKTTELGAAAFWPVMGRRSVVKLDGERLAKRQAHWGRVVLAAALQSERSELPTVHDCMPLQACLAEIARLHPKAELLWFTPGAESAFRHWHPADDTAPLIVAIGPEGGWSAEETALALESPLINNRGLSLSPRILRTETFGCAALSQLTEKLGLDPF